MKRISLLLFAFLLILTINVEGAVSVIKIPKPHLWLSLKAGGSIPAGTYYYICFYSVGQFIGYYGAASSPCSDEGSLTITAGDVTAGNQTINIEWYSDSGAITSFADAGGGQVTVNSTAHGMANGETAFIRDTTNYDGSYVISNVSANAFEITATWVATETGTWYWDAGFPSVITDLGVSTSYCSVNFRWDDCTMIDAGDSKPYQWLNLNATRWAGKTEFEDVYGDDRWCEYIYNNKRGTVTNQDFTEITSTGSTTASDKMFDGAGANYMSRARIQPDLAYRDHINYFQIDDYFPRDQGKLLVYFDNAGSIDQDDLIDALEASGCDDMFILSHPNTGYFNRETEYSIILLGEFQFDNSNAAYTYTFNDMKITLIGGRFYHQHSHNTVPSVNERVIYNRCSLSCYQLDVSFWIDLKGAKYVDTTYTASCNSFILDAITAVNFIPKAIPQTFYSSCDGFNMIGGFTGASTSFQFRYPNKDLSYKGTMQNMYIKDYLVYITYIQTDPTQTMTMNNVEFVNEGLVNYDYFITWTYMDGLDCDMTWNCTDVKVDRPTGQVKIAMTGSTGDPNSILDKWYFRYGIDLTVVDKNGDVVVGADVSLVGDETSTDTTDADGEATVNMLGYTIEYDSGDPDGYGYNTKTSAWKEAVLTVSESGYTVYTAPFTITEGQDWTIVLNPEGSTMIYDSTIYDSTIY